MRVLERLHLRLTFGKMVDLNYDVLDQVCKLLSKIKDQYKFLGLCLRKLFKTISVSTNPEVEPLFISKIIPAISCPDHLARPMVRYQGFEPTPCVRLARSSKFRDFASVLKNGHYL